MTHGRKPRQPRWGLTADTLQLAAHYARKIDAQEIAHIMQPIIEAFDALRKGTATENQWAQLDSSISLAQYIEAQGIVRGLKQHLDAAKQASHAIYQRAMRIEIYQAQAASQWHPTGLYYAEIGALRAYLYWHKFQLKNLSRGELRKALDKTMGKVQSMGTIKMTANPCPSTKNIFKAT